ncbi:ABC transporter substrate-binding protein [Vermiculatibacterium agrestimuris]|uniref:ABC transporter substrate-binding protein n=1 Tax=Vermiculatibacterium agrestimuris TaxID=2941519 RepID=UPI002041B08A|nr:ABC transporter substrate-binding protein [Vermiculatibacterium agrestimuris]
MKNRILALTMATAMTVGLLAGCGGGATQTQAPAPAQSQAASEPGAAGGTFKLGGIGPLTGDAAIYGNAAMNGAKIAVDEINALGGDIQFEFNPQDDQADGEMGVNAYNNLMDWGMQALVGPVTTGSAISVSAKVFEERVFALTPSASSPDVISGKDNMFQVCFTDPNQGVGSADYMAENYADAKVAVIYRNDDAYSQGIRDTFVSEAAAKNIEVVYEGTFTKDTQTDFSVQLGAAESAGATVLFLPIYYQPASVILAQAAARNYTPVFFGVDGMDGILAMEGFDTNLAEGVMLLTPFSADADDERTKNFVSEYQSRHGELPNQFAADGYDVVYVIYEALKAAGCTADMSTGDICEALVAAMPTISVDGLTGQGMTWAATGEVSKAPMAVVIKDGVYVTP